jgi:hypothetical protein
MVVESIAANDSAVTIDRTEEGDAMTLELNGEQNQYLLRNLYIADGELMHRDWFFNTNLGPIIYEQPAVSD